MSKFVVKAKDCPSNNEYVMFHTINSGEGCLATKEECTKFTSKYEADKALLNYLTFYNGILEYEYVVEELQEEEILNEKTYYVLRTFNCNNIKYQTFSGSVSIYLDKAQQFNNLEQAMEALSLVQGFDICKIVETTTSQKIDHEYELKKEKRLKLEAQKKELEKQLVDLNHESVSIAYEIEKIDDELQALNK